MCRPRRFGRWRLGLREHRRDHRDRLAGTIEAWWPETLLFLNTGLTNVWASHCTSW
jgi:hypothetical protein